MATWRMVIVLAILYVNLASCVLVHEPDGQADFHGVLGNTEQEQIGDERMENDRRQQARDTHTQTHAYTRTHRQRKEGIGETESRKLLQKNSTESEAKTLQRLSCTYDTKQIVTEPGNHQEPARFLSKDDFKKYGKRPSQAWDQSVRIPALRKVYNAVPGFFKDHLPGVQWWLMQGSAIAATRGGLIIPWDLDGDINIQPSSLNKQELWTRLMGDSGPTNLGAVNGGASCSKEDCQLFDLGSNVAVGMRPLPLPPGGSDPMRFIDLETGYFLEVLMTPDEDVPELQKCSLAGVGMPVPKKPMSNLDAWSDLKISDDQKEQGYMEYIGMHESGMECKLTECAAANEWELEKITKEQQAKASPFQQFFARDMGGEEDEDLDSKKRPWRVASPFAKWENCKASKSSVDDLKVMVMATCIDQGPWDSSK